MTTRHRINTIGPIWGLPMAILTAATAFVAPTAGSESEQNNDSKVQWSTSSSLGLTIRKGNTDTIVLSGDAQSEAKWRNNTVNLTLDGSYGESDGDRNEQSLHGAAQYDGQFNGSRTFAYLRLDGTHDGVAALDYRFTLGPGLGHHVVRSKSTSLKLEVGPGYVFERLGQSTERYYTLRTNQRFTHRINERTRIWQSIEWLPRADDITNWLARGEIGVETDITEQMALKVTLRDSYRNIPPPGRAHNDLKLITGVSYRF